MKEYSQKGDDAEHASGVTSSERYLGKLARQTFLSMWSYPNLYTDEGQKNNKGTGHELCDLMVVFENNILLFSDKHCLFPEITDFRLAWKRWYKRAILKSVNQIYGAEKWIREFPDRIFLDRQCRKPFPIPISSVRDANIFRLAVTRGSYVKCREFFGGQSSGSLMINTCIQGNEHLEKPFQVGIVKPGHSYVHVLDEYTLDILMNELDTISDFVEYLQKKEVFLFREDCEVIAAGEEELVAQYLVGSDNNERHGFSDLSESNDNVCILDGFWNALIQDPRYKAKKDADRISYCWDNLIEHFIKNGCYESVAEIEPALRVMASEPRIRRRCFAKVLIGALNEDIPPGYRITRLGISNEYPDVAYVFLVMSKPDVISDYNKFYIFRKNILFICCKIAKLHAKRAKYIVGIAAEPSYSKRGLESLIFLQRENTDWTPEQIAEAKELQEKHDFLRNTKNFLFRREQEYPDLETGEM